MYPVTKMCLLGDPVFDFLSCESKIKKQGSFMKMYIYRQNLLDAQLFKEKVVVDLALTNVIKITFMKVILSYV